MKPIAEKTAIIGNSAINRRGLGEVIDSFEDVIRFNRFSLNGYEEDVGSRTTLHMVNLSSMANKGTRGTKRIYVCRPDHLRQMKRVMPLGGTLFPPEWYASARALGCCAEWASTGMLVILWALSQGVRPVLFHFDWARSGHYFEKNHAHSRTHQWEIEAEYVKKLASRGAVNIDYL